MVFQVGEGEELIAGDLIYDKGNYKLTVKLKNNWSYLNAIQDSKKLIIKTKFGDIHITIPDNITLITLDNQDKNILEFDIIDF